MNVGDRVRSFDHADPDHLEWGRWLLGEHERAAYVEGEIVRFEEKEGCLRAVILVDYDVYGNKEREGRCGREVFPPVNGTLVCGYDNPSSFIEVIS